MTARRARSMPRVPVLLCLLALAAGCERLETQLCPGDVACPADAACCGATCVAASCLNDQLDAEEECQTWSHRSCFADGYDFGQVACTSACTLDHSPCARFGFTPSARPACGTARPSGLVVAGDALWTFGKADGVVGRQEGTACTSWDLGAPLALLAALDPSTAVTVQASAVSVPMPVQVLDAGAVSPVTNSGLGSPAGPLSRVVSARAVDGAAVYLGRTDAILTTVARDGAGWRAHSRRASCGGTRGELRSVIPRGTSLLITEVTPSLATIGVVARGATADELARSCTPLPYRLGVVATLRVGDLDFLIGNVTPDGAPSFAAVLEVGAVTGTDVALVERLGAAGAIGLPELSRADAAWTGPDATLYLLGRRADSSKALLAFAGGRWREIKPGMEGRRIFAGAGAEDRTLALTDHGLVEWAGVGYQLVQDLAARPVCAGCVLRAVAALGGAEWTLSKGVLWKATVNGVERLRPLGPGSFQWEPHRLAVRPGVEQPWFAAWAQSTPSTLYLLRGVGDRFPDDTVVPSPVPVVTDRCGATGRRAEAIALTLSAAHAYLFARVGSGSSECPLRTHLLARSLDARDLTEVWTGDAEISAAAAPHSAQDVVLAVVEGVGPAGAAQLWSFSPNAAAPPEVLVPALPTGKVRALWAETATSGWLAGDGGLLVRFDRGELTATLPAEPVNWSLLSGSGPDDLLLAATSGELRHYDGQSWSEISSPAQADGETADLVAVHSTADRLYLGIGTRLFALRAPRQPAVAPVCPLEP